MPGRLIQSQQFKQGIAGANCDTVAVTVSRQYLLTERRRRSADRCLTGVCSTEQEAGVSVNRSQQLAAGNSMRGWQAADAESTQSASDSPQQNILSTEGKINNED